jgi:YegS/Rv2252/BmrU family lipid kinase
MNFLIILNPTAGRGRAASLAPTIRGGFQRAGLEFDLALSERPAHTIELARRGALSGVPAVIAAGGDGTANEAINGLMQARSQGCAATALGMLSLGTGNDFAAGLGLPRKLDRSIAALKHGIRRTVDIGRVTGGDQPGGRYFGNCVGIGFDAAGTIQSKRIRWVKGLLAYLISAVQTIFFYYKAPVLEIEMDGEILRLPALMVSVMNGRRIGGGFWTAPAAKPDDGLFDICLAREVDRLRMFTLIPHFLRGTQASQPEVQMHRSKTVRIRASEPGMPVQSDGEILGEHRMELFIELLPKQLEVVGF